MKKSVASTVFGLMLIIIIIESTSLSSSLQSNSSVTMNPAHVQFSSIVTSAPPIQQMPLQSEQVKTALSPDLPIDTSLVSSQPASYLDEPADIKTPVAGNYMTGVWESSAVIPGIEQVPEKPVTPVDQINSMPTLVPGVGYVTYDNPLPDGDENISDFWRAVVVPEPTLPPKDYVEIFNQDQQYVYNTTAVSFYLRNPPMVIDFNVTPLISGDLKWIPNRDIHKTTGIDGKIINVTRPDQNSWFKVTVFDKENNGTIVKKEGYGGIYDLDNSKEITIREPGYYQVLIEGGYITAKTSIKVPRQGNVL
jgi:hypothetical protein